MPVAAVAGGIGVLQGIGGYIQERNAENALEKLQTPTYTPSSTIADYYSKALQRYSINPYDSPLYKMQQQNILRSGASGLTSLQGSRNAIGGVSNIVQAQNDALLKAGATAQQEQGQQLAQLGNAAEAQTKEGDKAFQYNQLAPYQKQYNLLAMKAGGGAGIMNAGIQNIFGGIGSAENMALAKQVYGSNPTASVTRGSQLQNPGAIGNYNPISNVPYGQQTSGSLSPIIQGLPQ